jgi:hypothetical protein
MFTVYFGPSGQLLQLRRVRAEGRTDQRTKMPFLLRRRLKRKRADLLASLLVELLGRSA